jgi:hypothetical protein
VDPNGPGPRDVIHYCTYFDRNYLTRAMALHRSLVRHSPLFTLWALCLDDDTHGALETLQLEGVRPIRLAELEAADPALLEVKGSRSTVEYYWTCSPILPRFLMQQHPEIDLLTYVDADLLFYSSPQPIFDEMGAGSVLIVPHRFPESLRHLEVNGVFNVGLLAFRSDAQGRAILDRWREQCLDWCYLRVEDDRMADQKYLDAWPGQPGVVVLQHPGAGLAPWNVMRYRLDLGAEPPSVDGHPLVFYHFQGLKAIRPGLWDLGSYRYATTNRMIRGQLYRPYIRELQTAARVVRASGAGGPSGATSLLQGHYGWRQLAGKICRGQVMVSWETPTGLQAARNTHASP